MGRYDREFEAFQIFEQIQGRTQEGQPGGEETSGEERGSGGRTAPVPRPALDAFPEEAPYYEIEYDSCPMPGVGKYVLKSDRSRVPRKEDISSRAQDSVREQDPVRELFNQMRDIARESRVLTFGNSRFYDKKIQQENSRIFYRQGMFMKDFRDDCDRSLPYSAYFPNYQMMGYGQLRTYFTWRTKVREGSIQKTSLSYAFLYLYELLNNIGVEEPQEGLERLMLFWDAYRVYDASLDKYVLKWLKDYHIYYALPWTFREFIREKGLEAFYPKLANPEDKFDLYCAISKYDIRKSLFYTNERTSLVQDCFYFTMDRLRQVFSECHGDFEEYIFQPTRNMAVWTPFQGALFYPAAKQADRRVVLSEKEIYLCSQNRWTFSAVITTESGRRLLGFCLKQMESVLRRLTKYRHKLSASADALSPVMADELRKDGISLEAVVTEAVETFYREATKTVVRVDGAALERIRREALATQERLIVPEEDPPAAGPITALPPLAEESGKCRECPEETDDPAEDSSGRAADPVSDPWDLLKAALSETERKALALALEGEPNLKPFADSQGIMLEVLMDGINEKAMDFVGDNLFDDEFVIYDDYIEQVRGMVETI